MSNKVSVIIPTFNMALTLERAIDSVLSQTYSDLEIIVVDDGSTDDTKRIVESIVERASMPIVYVRKETNEGRSAALNLGISKSTGEFIAFLEHDDTLPKYSLQDRVNFLEFNPQIYAVFTDTNFQDKSGNTYAIRKPPKNLSQSKLALAFLSGIKTPFHMISMMYRRSAIEKVGFFDPKYRRTGDIDFAYRVLLEGKVGYLPRPTYNYATTTHNLTARLRNRVIGALDRTRIICAHTKGAQLAYLLALNFLIQPAKLGYDVYFHLRYGKA